MLGVMIGYGLAGVMALALAYAWHRWIQCERSEVSRARRCIATMGLAAVSAAEVMLLLLALNGLLPLVTDSTTLFRLGRWSFHTGVLSIPASCFGTGRSRVAALGVGVSLVSLVGYALVKG